MSHDRNAKARVRSEKLQKVEGVMRYMGLDAELRSSIRAYFEHVVTHARALSCAGPA